MSYDDKEAWFRRRRAGVLLPLAALSHAAGDAMSGAALRFMQFLSASGFRIWQMLPVHPTDHHSSPYQGCSAFAGDARHISVERLYASPWMRGASHPSGPARAGRAEDLISAAMAAFRRHAGADERTAYEAFREECRAWLEDYALFATVKSACGDRPWWEWPAGLRRREGQSLRSFELEHAEEVEGIRFAQYLFFHQWGELRSQARELDLLLLGDMPLFVAHDSADVWSHPEYFRLDDRGQPEVVAGVPPDYFSATGQRWGSPLYNWSRLAEDGYGWWIERMRTQLGLFDAIRLDHFRGLESVWEIPADCATAERGTWRPVPGQALLETLRQALGCLPCIAEDLGIITPAVETLRRSFRLPGVKVLQFAFEGGAANPYLPHNHEVNSVVYTGTHDNNTTAGWFEELGASARERVLDYLRHPSEPMPWPMIHAALASVCRFAMLPMQDLLGLGASYRINTPGTVHGNWRYRLDWQLLTPELTARLRHLNQLYGRC